MPLFLATEDQEDIRFVRNLFVKTPYRVVPFREIVPQGNLPEDGVNIEEIALKKAMFVFGHASQVDWTMGEASEGDTKTSVVLVDIHGDVHEFTGVTKDGVSSRQNAYAKVLGFLDQYHAGN